MTLDLRSLIGKLDDTSRRALEGAAGLSMSRTHYEVEVEHWLAKLMEDGESDIPCVLRRFEMDPDRFAQSLDRRWLSVHLLQAAAADLTQKSQRPRRDGAPSRARALGT